MDISEELKEVYDRLSVHNRRFLRFVEETPEALLRASYENLFRVNNYLIKMQPWPIFLNRSTRREISDTAVKVFNLLKSIPFRVFSGDFQQIADYYEMPLGLVKYFFEGATQEHIDNLLARGDFIMSPNGMKCIEFNVNTNLGGMETALWETASLSVPVLLKYLNRYGLDIRNVELMPTIFTHIAENVIQKFSPSVGEINIAYAVKAVGGGNAPIVEYLNQMLAKVLDAKFPGMRGKIVFCEYSQLSAAPTGLFYQGKRIHAVIEMHLGYVSDHVTRVFKEGNVLIYNGAATWFMSTKLNLAVLSEREDSPVFSPAEQETIKKHIPWTRRITPGITTYKGKEIELPEFIIANRERLVLKPLVGSGGKDIYIGHKTSPGEWEKIVEKSLQCRDSLKDVQVGETLTLQQWDALMDKALNLESWLVQECLDSYRFILQNGEKGYTPHYAAWGFFVMGNHYGGGWTRALPIANEKGVVNAHQGAEMTLIYEVEE
jgi:hypothetical protein